MTETALPMPPTDVSLDQLRQSIDDIDDRILDLLMERAAIVAQVGELKAGSNSGRSPLRPGREATILRRLIRRTTGPLPRVAVLRIWRELISAMVGIEGQFALAICAPDEHSGLWRLAREHFGSIVPITAYPGPGAIMRVVAESPAVIGVLPFPREDDRDPWWRFLLSNDDKAPRVVARLPFAATSHRGADALVVGRVLADPSGDDRTLVAVESATEVSRARFLSKLKIDGIKVQHRGSYGGTSDHPEQLHLIELSDYVGPDDVRLAALQADAGGVVTRLVWLGAYAAPLDLAARPAKR